MLSANTLIETVYADWCGPCKAIAPVYEQLSKSLSKPGKVAFVKVNTDDQQDIARKYEITAYVMPPSFLRAFARGRLGLALGICF
jgi:thiol-disulfide isomerase/thioredoxin